jgi:hypothetical protein
MPLYADPLPLTAPLPGDVPFTRAQAREAGVSDALIRELQRRGGIRRVVHGVWVSTGVADSIELRAQALSLVLPDSAVVTDRTAAWLHGVPILPRTSHFEVPRIAVFQRTGTRVRRNDVDGGTRHLNDCDVVEIEGVRVTSPLRTALDLGRLLWRFDALAALDGFLRIGVTHVIMRAELERYRGYRGVVQLRSLVPIADGRSESPGESALRLHWYDAGLPRPELQWWVYDGDLARYRLDLALPEIRYAAEYDGAQHHSSPENQEADASRRAWLGDIRRWRVGVYTKLHVYDRTVDPCLRLRADYEAACRARRLSRPLP